MPPAVKGVANAVMDPWTNMVPCLSPHGQTDRLVGEPHRPETAVAFLASVMCCDVSTAEDAATETMCLDREPMPLAILADDEGELIFRLRKVGRNLRRR